MDFNFGDEDEADVLNDITFGEYGEVLDEEDLDYAGYSERSRNPSASMPSSSFTSCWQEEQEEMLNRSLRDLIVDDDDAPSSLSSSDLQLDLNRAEGSCMISAEQFLTQSGQPRKDIWANGLAQKTEVELCNVLGINKGWGTAGLAASWGGPTTDTNGNTLLEHSVQHQAKVDQQSKVAKAKYVIDSYRQQLFDRRHLADLEDAQRRRRKNQEPREPVKRLRDPYSGLMTGREKTQIIRIQLLQLHTDTPEADDYYYRQFARKRHYHTPENNSGVQLRDTSNIAQKQIPQKFEGSLGKVSYLTVHRPRALIDVEPPESPIMRSTRPEHAFKCSLLALENLWSQQLDIEETIAARRDPVPQLRLYAKSLHAHITTALQVSKGAKLLPRALRLFPNSEVIALLTRIVRVVAPAPIAVEQLAPVFSRLTSSDLVALLLDLESALLDGVITMAIVTLCTVTMHRWNELVAGTPSLAHHPNWMQFMSTLQSSGSLLGQ